MTDGISVVLSPTQLTAILSGVTLGPDETSANRMWGGLKLVAGSLEMVGAAALLVAPEPTMVTKVSGWGLAAHGSDTLSAGLWQVWTGKQQRTLTEQSAAELALRLGADSATAQGVGTAVDIAVPFALSAAVGAARIISVRFGRLSLLEHEAEAGARVGGHTILKHVGKTEAELRARLAAEPNTRTASTFKTLAIAERTLYQAVKANRSAIEGWAIRARPGDKQAFFYTAKDVVGYTLNRAHPTWQEARRIRFVLKMESYKGKLYYILTAFPQL